VEALNLILSSVAILGVAIIALLWKLYLPSYLKKKAEHLATKEDIGEITEQVKKVESKHAAELERLRSNLDQRKHVSNTQFELEFKTYQEIWNSLVEVNLSLRNLANSAEDKSKGNHIIAFANDYYALLKIVDQKRPFYPPEIWNGLKSLIEIIRSVVLELQATDNSKSHEEFSAKERSRFKKIEDQIDALCEAIRSRLTSLIAI
jgi:hypothetical protein